MSFAWPQLLGLLVVPLSFLIWELRHRRRADASSHPKILRAQAGPAAVELTTLPSSPGSVRTRYWLFAGLALAVVALARPQWGRLEEPVYDQSREILLAVDLSRSMLTPDVKPSRLDRTKLLIQSLLEKLAGERVGLVVFSGTSFLQAPLSADYEILREFLPSLGPSFLPEGGTNYGAMLDTAVQAFGATGTADRFLIVLSDGEATDPAWKDHLEPLVKKGIRVLALGVGTTGGDMIPEADGGFVKDERGAVVLSKLESATLQALARATGGVYRDASTWIDLAGLVSETIETGRKGEFVEKNTIRLVERFQWPLAFGLWCFLVSLYYEFPVRPKPRTIALKRSPAVKTPASLPPAAAMLCLLLAPLFFPAPPLRAAAKLAPAPATAAAAAPGEPSVLAKIVGRLSSSDHHTARDWAELSRETVTWGSRLQSEQPPVPEGPVRDALAAVALGEKIDPGATDWNKLRTELEALLQKKDPEDKKDQKKDQKDQQQKQDKNQKQDQSKQEEKDQDQSPEEQQQQAQDKSQPSDSSENKSQPQDQKKEEDAALGDMTKKEEPPPPPPPENTQQVGGQEKKSEEPKEQLDPALALPMQKLEQLRSQDSPAVLFQLMDGDRKSDKKSGPKSGKNW